MLYIWKIDEDDASGSGSEGEFLIDQNPSPQLSWSFSYFFPLLDFRTLWANNSNKSIQTQRQYQHTKLKILKLKIATSYHSIIRCWVNPMIWYETVWTLRTHWKSEKYESPHLSWDTFKVQLWSYINIFLLLKKTLFCFTLYPHTTINVELNWWIKGFVLKSDLISWSEWWILNYDNLLCITSKKWNGYTPIILLHSWSFRLFCPDRSIKGVTLIAYCHKGLLVNLIGRVSSLFLDRILNIF